MLVALIAVGLSALGGFGGLSVAAMLCLFPDAVRRRVVPALVSYVLAPHFLAFASASFVYVAMADLIPEMHRGSIHVSAPWQVVLVAGGVLTVAVL
jgi:zinc transporter ZupT